MPAKLFATHCKLLSWNFCPDSLPQRDIFFLNKQPRHSFGKISGTHDGASIFIADSTVMHTGFRGATWKQAALYILFIRMSFNAGDGLLLKSGGDTQHISRELEQLLFCPYIAACAFTVLVGFRTTSVPNRHHTTFQALSSDIILSDKLTLLSTAGLTSGF